MSPLKIAGILLLVAGAVVLVLGVYQLIQYNTSFFGKLSNKALGAFNKLSGSSRIAKGVVRPLIMIIAGGAGAFFGFVLSRKN